MFTARESPALLDNWRLVGSKKNYAMLEFTIEFKHFEIIKMCADPNIIHQHIGLLPWWAMAIFRVEKKLCAKALLSL